MAYQSRNRKYKNRREKLSEHTRGAKLIFIFAIIFAVAAITMNWQQIVDHFSTYFY